MTNLSKEAVEECMYDFGVLIWQNNLYVPEATLDAFFAERGTTRQAVAQAAYEYGVIFTSATLEPEVEKESVGKQLLKWIWK